MHSCHVLCFSSQMHGANGSLSGSDSDTYHQGDIRIDLSAVTASYRRKKHLTHHELVQSLSAPYR